MKGVFGCYRNTIKLRSGVYFDLANPPDDFTFADIAGALSKICRFGGQIDKFYSVAEHCWHCCRQAEKDGLPIETQRSILLHDAAEAFIGDVVKPLKVMLPAYKEIELRIEAAIAKKFGVDFTRDEAAIGKIDREMLIAERHSMFSRDSVLWTGENEVRRISPDFRCWDHISAEANFVSLAINTGINVNA